MPARVACAATFRGQCHEPALALGHALLAKVQPTPLLPHETDELDAFVIAIRRIEQESVRMIQAHIRGTPARKTFMTTGESA